MVLEALTEAGMATELCLVYPALAATPKVGPVAAGQDIYWRLLVGQQPLPVQRGGGQFDQNYLDYYSIRAVDALEMQLPQDFWPVPDYSALLYDL